MKRNALRVALALPSLLLVLVGAALIGVVAWALTSYESSTVYNDTTSLTVKCLEPRMLGDVFTAKPGDEIPVKRGSTCEIQDRSGKTVGTLTEGSGSRRICVSEALNPTASRECVVNGPGKRVSSFEKRFEPSMVVLVVLGSGFLIGGFYIGKKLYGTDLWRRSMSR